MISLKEPEGFGKALRDLLLKIQNEFQKYAVTFMCHYE
jgi:hypothetical protein